MSIIAWIVLGGIAGWIASMIMGTNASQGIGLNIAFGIVGALLGGFIFNFFGSAGVTGFNFYSLLVATVGAALFIWIVQVIRS